MIYKDDVFVEGALEAIAPLSVEDNTNRVVTTEFLRRIPLSIPSPLKASSPLFGPNLKIELVLDELLAIFTFYDMTNKKIKLSETNFRPKPEVWKGKYGELMNAEEALNNLIMSTHTQEYIDGEFIRVDGLIANDTDNLKNNYYTKVQIEDSILVINNKIDALDADTYSIKKLDEEHTEIRGLITSLSSDTYTKAETDNQLVLINTKIDDKVDDYDLRYIRLDADSKPNKDADYVIGGPNYRYLEFYCKNVYASLIESDKADVAELYSLKGFKPSLDNRKSHEGRVVVISSDENYDCEICEEKESIRILGVISVNPGYILNSNLANGVPVALIGRVPCYVRGKVKKGNLLKSGKNGTARRASSNDNPNVVFAKAMEDKLTGEDKQIEIVLL